MFMKKFEVGSIFARNLKFLDWSCLVDDEFAIWEHLNSFLHNLFDVKPIITFTLETEKNNQL